MIRMLLRLRSPRPDDPNPPMSEHRPFVRLLLLPAMAALMAFTVAIILIAVVFSHILVPGTTRFRAIYSTLVTIGATIITGLITSQIQNLLLARVDRQLFSQHTSLDDLDSEWRTVTKLASVAEKVKNWQITSNLVCASLITVAIVTGLNPSTSTRIVPYSPFTPDGKPDNCSKFSSESGQTSLNWLTSNGVTFDVQVNDPLCPPSRAVSLMNNINLATPTEFAYSDFGIEVEPGAVGAPISIYTSNTTLSSPLRSLLFQYDTDLIHVTQCVPVMTSNPISCQKKGNVTAQYPFLSVSSEDGGCKAGKNAPVDVVMGICTRGYIGQATIVIGAYGELSKFVAEAMGDLGSGPFTEQSSYAVTCMVDTRAAIQYQSITLTIQKQHIRDNKFPRRLFNSGPCVPPSPNRITEAHYGVAALATWFPLLQSSTASVDVLLSPIMQKVFQTDVILAPYNARGGPFSFPQSKSPLEDVLGLTSALVFSRIGSSYTNTSGTATVLVWKVGSSSGAAILCALPPLCVSILIIWLIRKTPRKPDDPEISSHLSRLLHFRAE
jgi:hypothetical protein